MSSLSEELSSIACEIGDLLKEKNRTIVFAESCTGGLCSATMTQVPGISSHLFGGFTTYIEEMKKSILEVADAIIAKYSCESMPVAHQMSQGARNKSKYSISAEGGQMNVYPTYGIGVVGDIGDETNHCIYISICGETGILYSDAFHLEENTRIDRQKRATILVLMALKKVIETF